MLRYNIQQQKKSCSYLKDNQQVKFCDHDHVILSLNSLNTLPKNLNYNSHDLGLQIQFSAILSTQTTSCVSVECSRMYGGYLGNQPSPPSPVHQGGTLSSLGRETACRVVLGEGALAIMHTKHTLGTGVTICSYSYQSLSTVCSLYVHSLSTLIETSVYMPIYAVN